MDINVLTRIFITGCAGMLGEAVYHHFKEWCEVLATDIDVNEDWIEYLDVRDFEQYREKAKSYRPDFIIHLAALTDLEYCELHSDEAYLTNTIGVENAVLIARELNCTLIYISTAGVFDGTHEYFDDWDTPNPINVYGRSKFLGEQYVTSRMEKYFILRAGWMIGGGPKKDKKFVNKLMKQLQSGATELNVVDDKLGTPTYTYDFAKNLHQLIKTDYFGVYNMVCEGDGSRYEVAQEILKILNKSNCIKLNKVNSEYFSHEYFVSRPFSEKLINRKLKLRELNVMGNWKERLNEYIISQYNFMNGN